MPDLRTQLEENVRSAQIERMAEHTHAVWARWIEYFLEVSIGNTNGSITVPAEYVNGWLDQMSSPFSALSEEDKEKDRVIAAEYLELMKE